MLIKSSLGLAPRDLLLENRRKRMGRIERTTARWGAVHKKQRPATRDVLALGSIIPFNPFGPFVLRIKGSLALASRYPLWENATNRLDLLNVRIKGVSYQKQFGPSA